MATRKQIHTNKIYKFVLNDFARADFEVSQKEWQKILKHDGKLCKATLVIDAPSFEGKYFDCKFSDGFKIEGLSGYHLTNHRNK